MGTDEVHFFLPAHQLGWAHFTLAANGAIRKLALAAVIGAASCGAAFAQSSPAPANQSGPGVSPSTPSPTDPSSAAESGNIKGIPERGTMSAPTTTGSGVTTVPRTTDRDNTSVPGQGVGKDDTTPRLR
jgi:hypothetical protein